MSGEPAIIILPDGSEARGVVLLDAESGEPLEELGGVGGAGDASAANQDEQTAILEDLLEEALSEDPFAATSAPPTVATVTIANGASTSGAFTAAGKLVGITTPAAWTAADLYVEWSADGAGSWVPVADSGASTGVARKVLSTATLALGAAHYTLSLSDWLSGGFLRLRSATASGITLTGVNQGASRDFVVTLAG